MIMRISLVAFLSLGAMYYAQDASVIKNTAEVYSGSNFGGTAKFNSMAGSMGALGGDLSAITVNPAGTGVFITGDVSATLAVQGNKNNSNLFGKSFESSYNNTNLGQVGGVVSFETNSNSPWQFVNLAFNYSTKNLEDYVQTPGNSSIKEAVQYESGGNTVNDFLVYNGHAYDRTGTASNLNVSLGGNYENKIYVGAGLNFKTAELEQSDFFQYQLQNLGEYAYYQKQYSPYRESSNGFSASVGIIGKINNNIRLGVAVESPTFWNLTRTYTEYGFNSSDNVVYGIYDETRKLTTPMKLTLSGAVVASKNFAVNIDYTLGVTKPKYKVEGSAEQQLNDYFSSDYKNTSDLRIGAEYRMAGFRLRGGYGIEANPFDASSFKSFNSGGTSENRSFSSLYIGKRQTLAGGLGYDFKSFYIDAGIQSITSTYDNEFYRGDYAVTLDNGFSVPIYNSELKTFTYGDGKNNETGIVSEVKNTKTNFFVTVGWKF
jgi:hypothetical protein